jgi:hydroxymethylglutaryl-CoA lyase
MLLNILGRVRPDRWIAALLFGTGSVMQRVLANDKFFFQFSNRQLPTTPWTIIQLYPEFTVFQHGRSIKIYLTKAKRGNSLSLAVISKLTNMFKEMAADKSIYRIVLTGEGKYFCTGMDLREKRPKDASDHFSALYDLFEAIDACPQTTIAAINGPTFGGGVGLAFVFDIRIAVSDATMCLSEVKLGLCPATISKFVVREWGISLARMAMLTGKTIYPDELHRIGAVHTVVPNQRALLPAVDQWLHDLKFTEPRASSLCKKLARDGWRYAGAHLQFQTTREVFLAMMDENSQSHRGIEDFRKGIRGTDWETALAHEVNNTVL